MTAIMLSEVGVEERIKSYEPGDMFINTQRNKLFLLCMQSLETGNKWSLVQMDKGIAVAIFVSSDSIERIGCVEFYNLCLNSETLIYVDKVEFKLFLNKL